MAEMNFEQARFNMIEQQIRPWEVLDQRVLDVLAAIPREAFVPARYRKLAFCDTQIPLGHGEVMMAPKVEARLLQALALNPTDHVLEIGTGSGFLSACLAALAARVSSVELVGEWVEAARRKLDSQGAANVDLSVGDGLASLALGSTYDAVAVTGSVPVLPDALPEALKPGGRLFVILGQAPVMEALVFTRVGPHEWSRECLFETDVPALRNAPQPQRFVF